MADFYSSVLDTKYKIKVPLDLGDDGNLATGIVFFLSPHMTQRMRGLF
jgi:hypothetical protein